MAISVYSPMSEDKMAGIGATAEAISNKFVLKTHWNVASLLPQPAEYIVQQPAEYIVQAVVAVATATPAEAAGGAFGGSGSKSKGSIRMITMNTFLAG